MCVWRVAGCPGGTRSAYPTGAPCWALGAQRACEAAQSAQQGALGKLTKFADTFTRKTGIKTLPRKGFVKNDLFQILPDQGMLEKQGVIPRRIVKNTKTTIKTA